MVVLGSAVEDAVSMDGCRVGFLPVSADSLGLCSLDFVLEHSLVPVFVSQVTLPSKAFDVKERTAAIETKDICSTARSPELGKEAEERLQRWNLL